MSNTPFEPFVRNAWYIAAWSEELGDEMIGRTIMNEPIVLFRDAEGRAAAKVHQASRFSTCSGGARSGGSA